MTADDSTQPRRSKPAGGWGALKGTFRALVDEKTIGEGGRALLKVNQRHEAQIAAAQALAHLASVTCKDGLVVKKEGQLAGA